MDEFLKALADNEFIPDVIEEASSLAYFEGNREEIMARLEAWKEFRRLQTTAAK